LEKENICETLGIGALLPAFCLHAVLATTMSHFSNVKVVYLSMLIFSLSDPQPLRAAQNLPND